MSRRDIRIFCAVIAGFSAAKVLSGLLHTDWVLVEWATPILVVAVATYAIARWYFPEART